MPQAQTYQSEFTGQEMDARFAAVAQLTDALEALTAVVAQKYVKPASGIPSTDMDADVNAALAKANTAVQSLADYYTKSEVDQLLAAINGMDYVDVATLPTASASTMGKIYLVGPDASGYYSYYYTSYDGSAYSWVGPLGTTQISLANYATKEEFSQLDQEIGDMSSYKEEGWDTVALIATTGYYFKFDALATYEQSLAEYVALSVQPGEKYLIDGWNWSSNAPLAFVRKAETTTKARAIYQSSAGHMSGEYTIPDGYDTLYVNGRTANYPIVVKKWVSKQTTIVDILDTKADAEDAVSAPLHVSVRQNANYVAGSSTVYGWNIAVGRRFNNSHDVVWFVGNKNSSINNFFDFQSIYLATRGEKKVSPESSTSAMTYILGHVTDYILPIVVAAVSNKDGDFPDNTSYYTGGYHGYGNATSGEVSQTMRQISRSVRLDGKELAAGDDLYGSVLEIDVVNNVQGCNTEKENGSGREIIQQHIHITMDAERFDVTVEWTALEAVNVHTLHCFGQYFDFDTVRFVGSTSKPGAYAKGTYHVTTDKKTSIVRNVGSSYTFDVEMDRTFGVADSFLGNSGNALATTSNKGYFNAVGDTPISMSSGDMVAYRGCYRFYPTPATT